MAKAHSYSAAAASLEVNSSAIPDILILVLVSGCKVGRLRSLMASRQFTEFTPKDCWRLGSRQATAGMGHNPPSLSTEGAPANGPRRDLRCVSANPTSSHEQPHWPSRRCGRGVPRSWDRPVCVEGSPARLAGDLINKLEADSRAARLHRQVVKPAI
jgi:hypothetical protein